MAPLTKNKVQEAAASVDRNPALVARRSEGAFARIQEMLAEDADHTAAFELCERIFAAPRLLAEKSLAESPTPEARVLRGALKS